MSISGKKILGIDENKENLIELISNIMEISPVGMTIVDFKGNITYANSWAVRIFGLTEDEVTQRTYNTPIWKITDFSGNPFPEEKLPFNLIMRYGKPVVDVRHAIEWPNGKRVYLSINASPLKDDQGNITGMVATIDDITDRIKTEEKLQLNYEELAATEEEIRSANKELIISIANEEKIGKQYKQLFENLTVGFALHEIICDKNNIPIDYKFIHVNAAFERLTGLKASEINGKRVLEILPKTEMFWIEKYGRTALTGEEMEFENYSVELNKYFHVRAYCPQLKQFAVIIEDVTEMKRGEKDLIQKNQELAAAYEEMQASFEELEAATRALTASNYELRKTALLLQSSIESQKDMIILAIDNKYNYLYFNNTHRISMQYAYGKDVEVGMNILDCITSVDDLKTAEEYYDRALNGESHSKIQEFGDIQKSYYESFYNPIRNSQNEIIGITAFARDITERRQMENALQKSEKRFRELVEGIPGIVYSFSGKKGGVYYSSHVTKLLGYTPEELYSRPFLWQNSIHPEDLPLIKQAIAEASENKPFDLEYRIRDADGKWHWFDDRSFYYQKGDTDFTIEGIALDITEQKATEERMLQSLNEKETLIQELFHRTKNTLQLIRGMLILQAVEFSENLELQKLVDDTEKRIMAISLVHQMLYQKQDLSQISIKEYIGDLSSLIMDSFNDTKDRISLNINIIDQYFLLDIAVPFGLIISELMTNSLKYGFPENRKGNISISLSNDGSEKYILRYSDNGAGVPSGFDFRKQSTLGMKLIFDIGEIQMKGRVSLENKEGVSCFFEFPKTLYKARV